MGLVPVGSLISFDSLWGAMTGSFASKQAAREWVWDELQSRKLARFPFPPHGRIPNFKGADQAAAQFVEALDLRKVNRVKVNPDAPQRPLRSLLLENGIKVYVPTPRLRGGFKLLDPQKIPDSKFEAAAGLKQMDDWAVPVEVLELPRMDWIVAGSVAVTRCGKRVGKGEGYSDIEYAILRELGHPEVPVVTTVHEVQVVEDLPFEETDLPVSLVATPGGLIDVKSAPPAPKGIDWQRLGEERLRAMPVLQELKRRVG